MLSSVFVAYFMHQFSQPVVPAQPRDRSYPYIRTVHPRGNLSVDAEAPTAGSVPPGAQRVAMLRLRLQADCSDDVEVRTITVQRRGLGANADIENIYAVHRGGRISRARTIARKDGSVDLNIRNFRLAQCDDEEVVVYADFSPTASPAGEHRLELRAIDAGTSQVRIEHRKGNFTQPRRTAGRSVGQISVDYLNLNRRVRFGARQTISRFTVKADSTDHQLLRAITFTNNGSASGQDLQNLYIGFRNRPISTIARSMNGDSVRLEFDPPFRLQKNQKIKFGLHADVKASRSRTLQFVIEEEADIEASPIRGR